MNVHLFGAVSGISWCSELCIEGDCTIWPSAILGETADFLQKEFYVDDRLKSRDIPHRKSKDPH